MKKGFLGLVQNNKVSKLVLILPNIRSAHNVGAMFRIADGAGVDKIYLVGYTPNPPHPQLDKVSLGAEKWVPWERAARLGPLLKKLSRHSGIPLAAGKKMGYNIVALEKTSKSRDIFTFKPKWPLALVVGNEKTGVTANALKYCDKAIHIPMRGKKTSLNVSVAAGIAVYQLLNLQTD